MRGKFSGFSRSLLLMSILALAFSGSAYGQSMYFGEKQSCAGLGLAFDVDKNFTGLGVSLGGSYAGRFDIGLAGSFARDRETSQDNTAVGVGTALYLVKQDKERPFSLDLGATFEISSVKLEYENPEFHTLTIFCSLMHCFNLDSGSRWIPEIGVSYSRISRPHKNSSFTKHLTNYFVSLHLASAEYKERTVAISPGLIFNEDNVVFNVTFELYIPTKTPDPE